MKKDDNNGLLLEIIRKSTPNIVNEFKGNNLYLATENITAAELGKIVGKPVNKIIAFFWVKGQKVSLNQPLSSDLLQDYCQSIKVGVKRKRGINFSEIIEKYLEKIDQKEQLVNRPPIVSIMGHIDHGKTTLLDTIRQTNFQVKEVGGITQKITASQIDFQDKKITFLDTPGHSDFIKLRQRGISLTDIVILVIEASDGIMSQTEEIINFLHHYQIPTIIFINHKRPEQTNNETNLNRIRTQLQEKGLTPLEWEGETIVISGNAKEKESANILLENILLVANCKSNPQHPTNGIVIDHYLHSKTGSTITEILVQDGKLQEKDTIFLNGKLSKVKMIYNLHGQKVAMVYPSDPVQVIGLTSSAELGDRFLVINHENTIKSLENELSPYLKKETKITPPPVTKEKENINLVLLADSQNSLEVLEELVRKKNSSQNGLWIIYQAIGKLNDSDLNLIKMTNSTILAFGLQPNQAQAKFFKENNISFFGSKIIHEIAEKIEKISHSQQKVEEVEEVMGEAIIEKIFYFSKVGQIAGCQVVSGKISRNNQVHVLRKKKNEKVFTGSIQSLESNKEKKTEVTSGHECGIVLKGFNDFSSGDKIVAFQMTKKNVSQT